MPQDDSDNDERELIPWAAHQPVSRISGVPTALIYMGEISGDVAQNDDSFAILFEDVEIVNGTIFENQERGDETGTVVDNIDEDEPRPTDFRFLDTEDMPRGSTMVDGTLATGENGPNTYDEVDEIDVDQLLVFYNGMSGSRVGRTLDFNGQNFAHYRSMGDDRHYLVKGLYQAHPEWRGASSSERSDLAGDGLAPRVCRAPILRWQVEGGGEDSEAELLEEPDAPRILIDVSQYKDTRGYELHIFEEEAFVDEFGDKTTPVDDIERGRYGIEAESELEYNSVRYSTADSILEQAGYAMAMHDEWEEPPQGWSLEYELEGDDTTFGVADEVVTEDDFAAQKQNFASEVAQALRDGDTPTDTFPDGIEGLVDSKGDAFYQEPTDDDVAEIRESVYEQTPWLDVADLE